MNNRRRMLQMLAAVFAFLVLIGPVGLLMHASWYYTFPWGITVIYAYFQIPLMVLVFMPAIDGLKVQWREASENLGASAWQYWRHVGGPLLAPAFTGATLLLFANALSAFATIEDVVADEAQDVRG